MKAVIISIGDEILNGSTINTNAAWISSQLQPLGVQTGEVLAISDNRQHIIGTLNRYVGKVDLLLITGGLGPTKDDVTKNSLCEFFGSTLVFHEAIYLKLKEVFMRRNVVFTENNRNQAEYPDNCTIIHNKLGTAQGMWFEKMNTVVISMPGVPFEMKGMLTDAIIPKIRQEKKLPHIINKYLMTSGISESLLAKTLESAENELPPSISLAYLPSPGVVKLRLTTTGDDLEALNREIQQHALKFKQILGNHVYADEPVMPEEYIGRLLLQLKSTLGTAESCTGGKIAHKLTSIPGSSAYYTGSVVSYSYELKTKLLGVNPDTLNNFGAVSAETVSEMLDGALEKLQTDFVIAVSGIAGPGGGTPDKPVGTVYIGVAGKAEKRITKYFFNKNRDVNIEYTCMFALHELRRLLEDEVRKAG